MNLKAELENFRAGFKVKAAPEIQALMKATEEDLAASGILDRALKRGDRAPDFTLPDARGRAIRLGDLLKDGRVILSFYRGGWCPYCNLELKALQAALPEIERLGAKLVAVSPQTPDKSVSTAEKNDLTFAVLSDAGSVVASAYGVAYALAEPLRAIYDRFGHALPSVNGSDDWVLPIPATYVIGSEGVIALAHVDVDYRTRLEPQAIIDTLASMKKAIP